MLKRYFPLVIFLYLFVLGNIYAQTYVPDDNFEHALIDLGYDDVLDDYVTTANISGVTSLNVSSSEIKNLTGIEGFSNLITLECSSNQLTSLNLSENDLLVNLYCAGNILITLDVSQCSKLKKIHADYNKFQSIDVDNNPDLEELILGFGSRIGYYGNKINVNNNKKLKILFCGHNGLEELDVSENNALIRLDCSSNKIEYLNVSDKPFLENLLCGNNKITDLNLTTNSNLVTLYCGGNQLTSLDISNNKDLRVLDCGVNQLTNLDVSNNKDMRSLVCSVNNLESLNVKSGNNSLITTFYAENIPSLTCIRVDNATKANAGEYPYKFWKKDNTATYSEDCVQIITVGDSKFEEVLVRLGIDTDGEVNGIITVNNISEITSLDLSSEGITNLTGIENFFNLETLNVSDNVLTSLDVSNNTALKNLDCSNNQLTGVLDLSNNLSLLDIDVSNNPDLEDVILPVYLHKNKPLKSLQVNGAQLTAQFSYNSLINLNISQTSLTAIDVSNLKILVTLNAQGSKLTSIDVSNNSILSVLNLTNNPLACIQVSQEQLDNIPVGWVVDATAPFSTDCQNYLGVDDELLTESLKLYPNPVSDILTVDSKLPLTKIEIYSILGQRVKEVNSDFNSISTNYLSSGIYMIKIYSEKGITVRKLIKQY